MVEVVTLNKEQLKMFQISVYWKKGKERERERERELGKIKIKIVYFEMLI